MDLELPLGAYTFKFQTLNGQRQIYDSLRRRFVSFTPEEYVRQHVIHMFIEDLKYPKGLMKSELSLGGGMRKHRCDVAVYLTDGTAFMIAECKAPHEDIDEKVLSQALRYHALNPAKFLILTNGSVTKGVKIMEDGFSIIDKWPSYPDTHHA